MMKTMEIQTTTIKAIFPEGFDGCGIVSFVGLGVLVTIVYLLFGVVVDTTIFVVFPGAAKRKKHKDVLNQYQAGFVFCANLINEERY